MGMKVLRHCGSGMARNIVRGCDCMRLGFVHDAQGGHVALNSVTETNSRVEPAADNIAVRVINNDLNANVGIFSKKRPNQRFQKELARSIAEAGRSIARRKRPIGLSRNELTFSMA